MSHELCDPKAKIGRAKSYLDSLKQEVSVFLEGQPYTFPGEFNPERTRKVFVAKISADPPSTRWGLMVGDCVHNARSALDQLAWRLAGSDETDNWTQFPIFIDRDNFYAKGLGRIKKLCDHAKAVIEDLQPFQIADPIERSRSPLWLLSEFDNADKHRLVPMIASAVTLSVMTPIPNNPRPTGQDLTAGPFHDGKVMGWIEFTTKVPPSIDVKAQFDIEIVFPQIPDTRATHILTHIVLTVERTIERFAGFF
jgi:hypothetical protein